MYVYGFHIAYTLPAEQDAVVYRCGLRLGASDQIDARARLQFMLSHLTVTEAVITSICSEGGTVLFNRLP